MKCAEGVKGYETFRETIYSRVAQGLEEWSRRLCLCVGKIVPDMFRETRTWKTSKKDKNKILMTT